MSYASYARSCCLGIGLGLLLLATSCGGGSSPSPSPPAPITVTISPSTASLGLAGTQQFTASVTGTSNTSVTWSVKGGGNSSPGTISATGLYAAPTLGLPSPISNVRPVAVSAGQEVTGIDVVVPPIPSTASVTVTATSVADSTKSATATVTVTPLSLIAVGGQLSQLGRQTTAGSVGITVKQGNSYSLFLVGNALVPGTSYAISGNPSDVQVTQPTGSDFGETTDNPPFPAVNVSIRVSGNAALGARNIMVTNPAGELSVFVGGLLITGP